VAKVALYRPTLPNDHQSESRRTTRVAAPIASAGRDS
jgi:hypothetical protein